MRFPSFPWIPMKPAGFMNYAQRKGGKKRAGERDLRFLLSYFSVFLFPVIRFSVGICGSRGYGIGLPMQNGTIPFPAGPAKDRTAYEDTVSFHSGRFTGHCAMYGCRRWGKTGITESSHRAAFSRWNSS